MRRAFEIGLNVLIVAACVAVISGVTYSPFSSQREPSIRRSYRPERYEN